jgi:LCP family protein required for cell wall assembly
MDNFRRRNHQQYSRDHRSPSTDGFISRGKESTAGAGHTPASGRRSIGSFQQADGFQSAHRTQRKEIGVSRQVSARQPIRDDAGNIRLDLPKDTSKQKQKKSKSRLHVFTKLPRLRTIALVFVIAFGSYFVTSAYLKTRDVFQGGGGAVALRENIDPSRLNGEGDGRVNVLLLGMDDAARLTDTIIVASIDPIHNEAALVSLPRDLYVQHESLGSMKINEIFPNVRNNAIAQNSSERQADVVGYQAIQDTVSEVLGIPMHYYASIDFDGFRRAIDTVGGVTMQVDEPVYEVLSLDGRPYVLNVQPGQEEFDGLRAMAYVRSRKTSPRGDFDRSERQRELLIALRKEVGSAGTFTNPARLNALFNDFADNVETNFSVEEVMRLNEIGSNIDPTTIESIELVEAPNDFIASGNMAGLSIQIPTAGVNNYSEIQSYIRNTLRDGYLRSEDASVLVLNGTSQADIAGQTTEELASFGYNALDPRQAASSDIPETILVDLTGGEKKYTKRYLEQRFQTFASTRLPAGVDTADIRADFVILIGQNEISRIEN